MSIGLESCVKTRPAVLCDARFGLLMNRASVDRELRPACDLLADAFPGRLTSIFSPQHGLWGDAQANMVETPHSCHTRLVVPIYSLYSETRRPTADMLREIDCLVVDLQDVGTRVYTFVWTVLACLQSAAEANVSVLILDRPNPLGHEVVEGPILQTPFRSFVGEAEIPMRHGLSLGELALWLNRHQKINADVSVVPFTPDQNTPTRVWVPPSPNMPRNATAWVYPGQVLLEGTNLSEGRGTTAPFEMIGAPYVDEHELWRGAESLRLPGVRFLPLRFRPTFDKWQGQSCGGVSIHVTDRTKFRSYEMTVRLLAFVRQRWPDQFRWTPPPYEYEYEKPPIDILSGSGKMRTELSPETAADLCHVEVAAWEASVRPALLYPRAAFTN